MAPFKDYCPEVLAAGQASYSNHDTAKMCLDWNERSAYKKKSLLDPIQHMPGKISANIAAVSEKSRKLTHGLRTQSKYTTADILSPVRMNPLLQELQDLKEKVYHRKEHQVLGQAIPNLTVLPDFTKAPEFKFGISTKPNQNDTFKIMMGNKSVEPEAELIRRRYILSHKSYGPGEHKLHYGHDFIAPNNLDMKQQSREDNDGNRVRDSLYWDDHRQQELKTKIVNKRLADFRERNQPELGKVHDPMKDTMSHLSPDHVFGMTQPPDEFSVGHLIGSGNPIIKSGEKKKYIPTSGAGMPTRKESLNYDQSARKYKLQPGEDMSLVLKVTEDIPGGQLNTNALKEFSLKHVFGVPSIRQINGPVSKSLADTINYADELSAKGLMYPTPLNIYGREQLDAFAKIVEDLGAS